ncbi:uncharacterized protein PFL1_00809 [Pseudozyma flocculosa PF-1]|uniref:Zn(2)-C6 fungal-type domain-containing protein n=1 Tax=Pseudozyma flocculosa TaxID=84751 RepID=A0A5C3F341_9BASI|nr:uncharacterized protein PFL1_00809 [Pseudozyma flocculosa PF-1]EPQ31474.1 hypothetical protein PFL1_00809 [Pseudozyma flocculosa PF-1]SPO38742.1 uncharacterized protein PSFLO_04221 [Pseudozyma flocculosa]
MSPNGDSGVQGDFAMSASLFPLEDAGSAHSVPLEQSSPQSDSSRAMSEGAAPPSCSHQAEGSGSGSGSGSVRKRVYRACEVCRRKKVKCNGKKPCSHCIAFVEECHYADTKDRTAYSRRYVESLEQRLAKMEQAFLLSCDDQRLRLADGNASQSDAASPVTEMVAPPPLPKPKEEREDHSMDLNPSSVQPNSTGIDDRRDLGVLRPDRDHHLRYAGPGSTLALVTDLSEASSACAPGNPGGVAVGRTQYDSLFFGSNDASTFPPSSALGETGSITLPHRSVSDRFVQVFFDRIHPVFPVLCRDSFTAAYEGLFQAPSAASQTADVALLATVSALLACGELASCQLERGETGQNNVTEAPFCASGGFDASPLGSRAGAASSYFSQCHDLGLRCLAEPRIETVQLALLQAYYMASTGSPAKAWICAGHATRLAQDLGLHRNVDHATLSPQDRELRRRTWWCVYVMDRLLGISLGRPFGIEDDHIDAQLPFGDRDSLKLLMPGFIALICLTRQAGRVARTIAKLHQARVRGNVHAEVALLQKLRTHDAALDSWQASLPETLRSRDGSQDPADALTVQSCVAYSQLHTTRMHLQMTLLRDSNLLQTMSSIEQEKTDLARCTQTALHIIKATSRTARLMPPGHYLAEYSRYLIVAGGFLASSAAKDQQANAFQLLNEAEEAINSFRHLVPLHLAAAEHRRVLIGIVRGMRSRVGALGAATPLCMATQQDTARTGRSVKRGVTHPADLRRPLTGPPPAAMATSTAVMSEKRRRCTVSTYPVPLSHTAANTIGTARLGVGVEGGGGGGTTTPATFDVDWTLSFAAYDLGAYQRGCHPDLLHAPPSHHYQAQPSSTGGGGGETTMQTPRSHLDDVSSVRHGAPASTALSSQHHQLGGTPLLGASPYTPLNCAPSGMAGSSSPLFSPPSSTMHRAQETVQQQQQQANDSLFSPLSTFDLPLGYQYPQQPFSTHGPNMHESMIVQQQGPTPGGAEEQHRDAAERMQDASTAPPSSLAFFGQPANLDLH